MIAELIPATPTDRDIARRLWARLDVIYGYPRTLAESEITRTGPASQLAALPYIESLFSAYLHDSTGAAALHGVSALVIDDPPAGMLARSLTYNSVTRTLGQWLAFLETTVPNGGRGWVRATSLPGVADAWTLLAVRDGEAGSATGVPIPPGEE